MLCGRQVQRVETTTRQRRTWHSAAHVNVEQRTSILTLLLHDQKELECKIELPARVGLVPAGR
jgi:hypothetical protein